MANQRQPASLLPIGHVLPLSSFFLFLSSSPNMCSPLLCHFRRHHVAGERHAPDAEVKEPSTIGHPKFQPWTSSGGAHVGRPSSASSLPVLSNFGAVRPFSGKSTYFGMSIRPFTSLYPSWQTNPHH